MNNSDRLLEEYCMDMLNICHTLPNKINIEGNIEIDFGMIQAVYLNKILAWDSYSGYHGNVTSLPDDIKIIYSSQVNNIIHE